MILTFLIACLFSFLGSIPPGSINLSVLQLAADNKINAALRFALAAALIEFPYVLIALQFEDWISSSPLIINNIKLISALVMIVLGVINTVSYYKTSPNTKFEKFRNSGFRKGLIISIFNPMAIPFWIGITAYLNHQNWILIMAWKEMVVFALGVSAGTFLLLASIIYFSKVINVSFQKKGALQLIPAAVFYLLGIYGLIQIMT